MRARQDELAQAGWFVARRGRDDGRVTGQPLALPRLEAAVEHVEGLLVALEAQGVEEGNRSREEVAPGDAVERGSVAHPPLRRSRT
jgi:hypothetical protein